MPWHQGCLRVPSKCVYACMYIYIYIPRNSKCTEFFAGYEQKRFYPYFGLNSALRRNSVVSGVSWFLHLLCTSLELLCSKWPLCGENGACQCAPPPTSDWSAYLMTLQLGKELPNALSSFLGVALCKFVFVDMSNVFSNKYTVHHSMMQDFLVFCIFEWGDFRRNLVKFRRNLVNNRRNSP